MKNFIRKKDLLSTIQNTGSYEFDAKVSVPALNYVIDICRKNGIETYKNMRVEGREVSEIEEMIKFFPPKTQYIHVHFGHSIIEALKYIELD